jgi:hypothetical protein
MTNLNNRRHADGGAVSNIQELNSFVCGLGLWLPADNEEL